MVGEPVPLDSEGPVTDDFHRMASPLAIAKCPGSGHLRCSILTTTVTATES